MSTYMFLSSPYNRLAIDADEDTITIRARDQYGFTGDRVSIRPTSADVAAMRAALDKLDTTNADADALAEAA